VCFTVKTKKAEKEEGREVVRRFVLSQGRGEEKDTVNPEKNDQEDVSLGSGKKNQSLLLEKG